MTETTILDGKVVWTQVVAGIFTRPDGQILVSSRPPGKAYAGYWEFPGGKIECGESPEAALRRELEEELGVHIRQAVRWLTKRYVYPHAHVELQFFRIFAWDGDFVGREGQAFQWQNPAHYSVTPLLPANIELAPLLNLPPVYGISAAEIFGVEEFLQRAQTAIDNGLQLMQLRDKALPMATRITLFQRLYPIAKAAGCRMLWNGTMAEAMALGADGVHLSGAALQQQLGVPIAPPPDFLVAASLHCQADCGLAEQCGVHFAVLGPVLATATHPEAATLGWSGFAEMAGHYALPVYVLGGMQTADLKTAITHGAHGIAMLRGAW